jgi:hypothetical protein
MKIGNYLVYLAHSNPDLYNELIFSVYSFKRYHSESKIQIIIYTDNESYLRKYLKEFDVTYLSISPEILTSWSGTTSYIYKTKIVCLLDATSRFNGNFLFVDTNTYFVNQCIHLFQQIHAGRLLLHELEKSFSQVPKTRRLIGKKIVVNDILYTLKAETEIWNTGTIGVASHKNFVLQQASVICDKIYEVRKNLFSEQVALSLVFKNESKIVSADYAIFHYNNLKEFRPELRRLLAKPEATSHKYLQELVRSVNPISLWKEKQEWNRQNRFRMPLLKLFDIRYRLQPIRIL